MAGIAAGFFGIGGGLIIVPSLVYLLGFDQHKATGTSLAILLPPLGLGAVWEYHKKGNVDFQAAIVIGILLALGAWVGGKYANQLKGPTLQLMFGAFAVVMGSYTIWTAVLKIRK
ncbi:MAG: sulfite exporter TauE/SafE family protein [Armatimonadetes bacterium]|nr:sulfite exporter TauE/SafE family protein [Armatimonadota bacterium]